MMAATALTLGGLAAQFSAEAAVVGYAAYMAFQWMSEPGLNTLLMNHVDERERGGASALTYLVAFGAQAVAAYAGGQLLERFGFGPVLGGAGLLAALAALGFFSVYAQPPWLPPTCVRRQAFKRAQSQFRMFWLQDQVYLIVVTPSAKADPDEEAVRARVNDPDPRNPEDRHVGPRKCSRFSLTWAGS